MCSEPGLITSTFDNGTEESTIVLLYRNRCPETTVANLRRTIRRSIRRSREMTHPPISLRRKRIRPEGLINDGKGRRSSSNP